MPAKLERKLAQLAEYAGDEWERRAQRPDRTCSRVDGLYYFLDLPAGEYEVRAALPNCGKRYGEKREKKEVFSEKKKASNDDQKQSGANALKSMWLELALGQTAIHGRITDAAKKTGVMMAEVRLKGSGERTFSDARGEFTLGPIEASKSERTLECSAQGYLQKEQGGVRAAEPGKLLELKDIGLQSTRRG
jgi:hypothetical protein